MFRSRLRALLLAAAAGLASPAPAADTPTAAELKAVTDKGYDFLKTKQKDDGSFGDARANPGVTALAAAALVRSGKGADDPVVAKALKYLETKVQKDGGVHDNGFQNYMTCCAIMAFKEANTDGKYDKFIKAASDYVRGMQVGGKEEDAGYGGAGYGGKGRPDLSNTHFFVEALIAAGAKPDDPAIKKALAFVSRSQNLASEEYNKLPFAAKATADDKGGFVYSATDDPASKKNPKATPEGGLRSEGGMTYAGLKSFLYAGVGRDDARVKAALDWIRKHYTVDENPGMGKAGLYYYYHVFSKAMDALGEPNFEDAKGVKHPWKRELFEKLKKEQQPDGSWVNGADKFMEAMPELAASFALLSLSYCK
jgi:squalene-hopene/tetraprenyl-beta-curcumene cyclase